MSVAELVEFNDDGEARVECVCTAGDRARGLEAAETRSGHTKTSRFQEMIAAVAQGFRVPPRWFLAEEQNCWTPW